MEANKKISWERGDPYRTLGIGSPLPGLKPGDIVLEKEEVGEGSSILFVIEVERKGPLLQFIGIPFSGPSWNSPNRMTVAKATYDHIISEVIPGKSLSYSRKEYEVDEKNRERFRPFTKEALALWDKQRRLVKYGTDIWESQIERDLNWERNDPYGMLDIGTPLPGLKPGDIISRRNPNGTTSIIFVVNIERQGNDLIFIGIPFSGKLSKENYNYIIKDQGVFASLAYSVSKGEKDLYKIITKEYTGGKEGGKDLLEWDRSDPYRTLGIGNPFNSIKEGDVIIQKSEGSFTWRENGAENRFSPAGVWGIIIGKGWKNCGLYLQGIFFTMDPREDILIWNRRLIGRLSDGDRSGYVVSGICKSLPEWFHHFNITKKEEWEIIKDVN